MKNIRNKLYNFISLLEKEVNRILTIFWRMLMYIIGAIILPARRFFSFLKEKKTRKKTKIVNVVNIVQYKLCRNNIIIVNVVPYIKRNQKAINTHILWYMVSTVSYTYSTKIRKISMHCKAIFIKLITIIWKNWTIRL